MILPELAVERRAAEVVLPQAFPELAEPGGSPVVLVKRQERHR